jgi:excisionase family DNA binding protein
MSTSKARSNIAGRPSAEGELGVKWLTTGQVAKRLGVSSTTVGKWIDSGRLTGIRLPGSKDRRVHPIALADFERRYGIDRARGVQNAPSSPI